MSSSSSPFLYIERGRSNTQPNTSVPGTHRPLSAEGKSSKDRNRSYSNQIGHKGGLHKFTKMFRKQQHRASGDMSSINKMRIPGFDDDFFIEQKRLPRPGSPESPKAFRRNRSNSVGSRVGLKVRKGKDREDVFFMWKPIRRKKCEWESISGRQLTIKDAHVTELSKVEIEALQQIAVSRLQELDIAVSKNSIRSGKLKIAKRRTSNGSNSVFGQPLTTVLDQDKSRTVNSPTHVTPPVPFSVATSAFSAITTSVVPLSPSTTAHLHPEQPIASPGSEPDTPDTINSTPTLILEQLDISSKPVPPRPVRRDSLFPANSQVPLLVRKSIDHLDNNGIKTEGLFRIPGAKARIDMMKQKFDKGEDFEFSDETSPHDVACVLKEFFRSLPEPLMTRELYYPLLKTRKLATRALQKNALRLLVMLLPRPNRDTLQELLQFLSRVALHSNGIILIDGTEESGNRMTEENLATVLGPNILHNESRVKNAQTSYQVMKQDPEELTAVCHVMTDLIRMQESIFTIPAELYDATLKHLFCIDHESVDAIMRRKCLDMENAGEGAGAGGDGIDSEDVLVHHPLSSPDVRQSRSSDNLNKLSVVQSDVSPGTSNYNSWHRSHSFNNDAERSLDDVMKNLEELLSEGLSMNHRRHFSNDSAMGESESITSPLQNPERKSSEDHPSMYNSVDSAISNHSPHHSSSSEADSSHLEWLDEMDSAFITIPAHTHTSSGISTHSESPAPSLASPLRVNSPKLLTKGKLVSNDYTGSLPVLSPLDRSGYISFSRRSSSPFILSKKLRKSIRSVGSHELRDSKKEKKFAGSLDNNMPIFDLERSPILGRRNQPNPESTNSDCSTNKPSPITEVLTDLSPRFHFVVQPATEVLI